jgi:hypothetical protein
MRYGKGLPRLRSLLVNGKFGSMVKAGMFFLAKRAAGKVAASYAYLHK